MKTLINSPKFISLLFLITLFIISSCNKEVVTPPNYALQFEGLDGQVIFNNTESLNPTDAITISMWVRLEAPIDCDGTDEQVGLLYKGYPTESNTGYRIHVNQDGAVGMEVGTEGGYVIYGTGRMLELNRWAYLTFVYNSSNSQASIYWNGELNTDGGYGDFGQGRINVNLDNLQLNTLAFTKCGIEKANFPGSIDDLSIWKIALTPQQIIDIKNNGIKGTETGLISYWSFNEGTDLITEDKTGNNTGELLGGVEWIKR